MNQKKAVVYYNDIVAGSLIKEDTKYIFQYSEDYLINKNNPAISLTLPKRIEPFIADHLFPFFYGLLAEGENKQLQCRLLKIDENDHFTRLIKTADKNTIGGITVREVK